MPSADKPMPEGSTPVRPADEYAAPALIVLGRIRDLTESHHHHHHYHRHWDGPNGLHPPGLLPPLFNGSA